MSKIEARYSNDSRLKVLVIGLGQLGLPVAKYVKDQGGFDVYGYDISTKAIDRAQKIAGIKRIGDYSRTGDITTGNEPDSSRNINPISNNSTS
ncbi:MAG TPA: hypothetical protein VH796_01305, partial [Nitrososphaeraceae archaeon]